MPQRIVQVDAFTDEPFTGNPAAVCIMDGPRDESWMQQVALEMNLSETAFLYPEGDRYNLRWFTPTVEVHLCGHATLASAHVLYEQQHLAPDQTARFNTISGELTATKRGDLIELSFPAVPVEAVDPPEHLLEALGVRPVFVGHIEPSDFLVVTDSEQAIYECKPNFAALLEQNIRGVIITTWTETGKYDFVSRFFAPGAGINEDPVTGYAHCVLGPHWAGYLDKKEFSAFQASARGGVVQVRVEGDRVFLGGKAVTVMRAELLV